MTLSLRPSLPAMRPAPCVRRRTVTRAMSKPSQKAETFINLPLAHKIVQARSANDPERSLADPSCACRRASRTACPDRGLVEEPDRKRDHCRGALWECVLRQGRLGFPPGTEGGRHDHIACRRNPRPYRCETQRKRLGGEALHPRRQHPCLGPAATAKRRSS